MSTAPDIAERVETLVPDLPEVTRSEFESEPAVQTTSPEPGYIAWHARPGLAALDQVLGTDEEHRTGRQALASLTEHDVGDHLRSFGRGPSTDEEEAAFRFAAREAARYDAEALKKELFGTGADPRACLEALDDAVFRLRDQILDSILPAAPRFEYARCVEAELLLEYVRLTDRSAYFQGQLEEARLSCVESSRVVGLAAEAEYVQARQAFVKSDEEGIADAAPHLAQNWMLADLHRRTSQFELLDHVRRVALEYRSAGAEEVAATARGRFVAAHGEGAQFDRWSIDPTVLPLPMTEIDRVVSQARAESQVEQVEEGREIRSGGRSR